MKKLCAAALSTVMLISSTAFAENFNNSAFMGTWTSSKYTDDNYSQLYINYCDDSTINVTLKQIAGRKGTICL